MQLVLLVGPSQGALRIFAPAFHRCLPRIGRSLPLFYLGAPASVSCLVLVMGAPVQLGPCHGACNRSRAALPSCPWLPRTVAVLSVSPPAETCSVPFEQCQHAACDQSTGGR